ncbi:MAG: hypothetical protein DRQ43_05625 [Gammaproteobacteria bacterium]|nr:MAG: hypothetical protein DRQ43_05625 [Gammaproteobacteria bacterium]
MNPVRAERVQTGIFPLGAKKVVQEEAMILPAKSLLGKQTVRKKYARTKNVISPIIPDYT